MRAASDYSNDSNDSSTSSLAFVVTWEMTNNDMIYNENNNICYEAPGNVNNFDATVAANVIFGLTRSLIWYGNSSNYSNYSKYTNDKTSWFNDDIEQIYENTTNLLIWIIEKNWVNNRPDLVFLYYPSKNDFYWFISRVLTEYRNKLNVFSRQYPFIHKLYFKLNSVMKQEATDQILSNSLNMTLNNYNYNYNEKTNKNKTYVYYFWQEFLGINDSTKDNIPTPHYDDRLFNTAMCVNALLNIWTITTTNNSNNSNISNFSSIGIVWLDDTPNRVKTVLSGAILFLKENSLNNKYRADNAFFSGSFKTPLTFPWIYPANVWKYTNGTIKNAQNVTENDVTNNCIIGVRNVINNNSYNEYMKMKPAGCQTPRKFNGYNYYRNPWPFWSSHAITHASTLLAVAKYDLLMQYQSSA